MASVGVSGGQSSAIAAGDAASGAADSGNPVKVGGKYNLTPAAQADGSRIDLQLTARGYPRVVLTDSNSTTEPAIAALGDAVNGIRNSIWAAASGMLYNGNTWDRLRTPAIFKTATATAAGDTALWTPTSGKKFRLMRFYIEVTENVTLAAPAVLDILLRDATTAIGVGFSDFVPAAAVAGDVPATSGWIDLGNGFLSALANNVLNINLSAALTAGICRVVACGTEE